jgi:hypothetical protein
MKSINLKWVFPIAIALITIGVISCQKDLSGDIPNNAPLPDLTSKVASTVSGFVTDENNAAVQGASVQVGNITVTTDAFGYFAVYNTQVTKNAAVVTVSKAGYFKGIKTYIAETGKSAFFRIKLIPKSTSGSFDAATGGTVSASGGLSILFPANAIVNASSNAAYSGNVNVAVHWINPAATDLPQVMPGDLRGLDEDGYLKVLTTYGMAAVEMTGSGGELLQIATGSKATITFPIPGSLSGSAPADLPLWYFDESLGLWKQDGSATKNGSNYVGDVSHFSFWNCDVPSNFVQFNCTIVDGSGQPIPHVLVKISRVSNPNSAGYGYTDSSGYTGGAVPNNAQLLLEVFPDWNCGTAIYSQTFTTGSTNISLGTITVNNTSYIANLSGTVTDCNAMPVSNGCVLVSVNQRYYRFAVSNSGTFDFNILMCSPSSSADIIAEDLTNMQQGTALTVTLNSGSNVLGNLQACGTNTAQFINLTVNGTNYNLTSPADSIMQTGNSGTPTSNYGSVYGFGTMQNYINFSYTSTGLISVGAPVNLAFLSTSYINDSLGITTPIAVNITEYGAVGTGFIAGNFTGILQGAIPPPGGTYNVNCSFRVRRRF